MELMTFIFITLIIIVVIAGGQYGFYIAAKKEIKANKNSRFNKMKNYS